jgi:hypothetical protein
VTSWGSLPCERIAVPREALSREITVPVTMPGVVSLPAAERLASRLYTDLTALGGPTGADLRPTLTGAPPRGMGGEHSADDPALDLVNADPRLGLRLVVADLEQLWRDQLIAAAALVLVADDGATPEDRTVAYATPSGDFAATARLLLVYRLHAWTEPPNATDVALPDRAWERPVALPPRLSRGRLVLLLSWTPAINRRSWVFPRQVYTYQWEPRAAITLDRGDAGGDQDDAEEWTICRPRRPRVLR